jgi:histidyl-tRNA synthetase
MLNYANKLGVPYAVIVGEDEIKEGLYSLKNMLTGEQAKVTVEQLIDRVKNKPVSVT